MPKTASYIDGFNLYHAIDALGDSRLKWVNLRTLATSFLRQGEELSRVVYFSAVMVWDPKKSRRHNEYLAALKAVKVEPVLSKFLRSNKHCRAYARYCDFHEEKQTDVAIAARLIADVMQDGIDRIILITADSDQVPAVAALRAMKPQLEISIACPPGRVQIARELGKVAHNIKEISRGRLERSLFPRNVRNEHDKVVARSPAAYQIPA